MRHALAVRQDNNGDVILTGPAVRALRNRFDRVSFLAAPTGEGAARLLPGVDRVVVARTEWIDGAPRPIARGDVLSLVSEIEALSVDEAFIFTSWHQSPLPTALVLRLAGVRRIHAISIDYPGALLDTRARVDDEMHEVDRNLSLLVATGIEPPVDDRLALTIPPDRCAGLPEEYLVVHPGSTAPARAWSPERNAELVAALVARGERVVVTGTSGERDLCERVAGSRATVVCNRSFAEYASIVRDARCIIVGNTAGAHVAAAFGTPVVSIFPPTIPSVRFRPWRVAHELLGDQEIACAGCHTRICPIPGQPCLAKVDVERAIAAIDRLAPASLAAAR